MEEQDQFAEQPEGEFGGQQEPSQQSEGFGEQQQQLEGEFGGQQSQGEFRDDESGEGRFSRQEQGTPETEEQGATYGSEP